MNIYSYQNGDTLLDLDIDMPVHLHHIHFVLSFTIKQISCITQSNCIDIKNNLKYLLYFFIGHRTKFILANIKATL